eukprot:3764453-Amphidinium_carterae.1
MLHAAQREIFQRARRQEIRRYGQPYNGRARPPGAAANLNVNIYNNVAVVDIEGGDRYEPPKFGPVRFDEYMRANLAEAGRPLIRLNPQQIPLPENDDDEDGDGFGIVREVQRNMVRQHMEDQDPNHEEGEREVLNMDQDGHPPGEHEYPYPTSFEELVITPDHLDWSARVVYMLNQRQHITWDACHLCGMYCSSRWCNSCEQPVCPFHAVVYQRPRGPLGQPGSTRLMCRRCVELSWDNFITAVGYGGLVTQPGAPGRASHFGF